MERKGELTSTQVVTIILAIIGFVLVGLGLYTIFEDDSLTNRDLCRLSVLSRATVPSAGQQFVPLNCQTEKVCITVDDGSILGFGGNKNTSCKQFAGEKNIRTVEVKVGENVLTNDNATETIQREVANAMYDCWLMTGQGKLDIFPPGDGTSTSATEFFKQITAGVDLNVVQVKPSCIVCSRIAFSDALYQADKELSAKGFGFLKYIEINRFLERTPVVPGTERSYTSMFTGEQGTGYGSIAQDDKLSSYYGKTSLTEQEYQDFKNLISTTKLAKTPEEVKFYEEVVKTKESAEAYLSKFKQPTTSDQIAIVFAQLKVNGDTSQDAFWNAFTTGGIAGGIAAISSPGSVLSLPVGIVKVLAVGAVATGLAYSAEANTIENHALSAATCGEFESTDPQKQKGCSLVKLMNWDANNVNSLCTGGIEGNL